MCRHKGEGEQLSNKAIESEGVGKQVSGWEGRKGERSSQLLPKEESLGAATERGRRRHVREGDTERHSSPPQGGGGGERKKAFVMPGTASIPY